MIRAQEVLYPRSRSETLDSPHESGRGTLPPGRTAGSGRSPYRAAGASTLFQWLTLVFAAALLSGVACNDDDDDGGSSAVVPEPVGGELQVLSMTPADGATGVSSTAQIVVTFSAALDTQTVDAESLLVTGSTSGTIQGTYAFADDDETVLFTPDAPYAYEETVEVVVTADVTSTEGGQLTQDFTSSFTVEEEPTPPPPPVLEILGTQPPDGATGVSNMAQIQVLFSDALDTSTVSADSFAVTGSTSGVRAGTYSFADGDRTALFSPGAPYAYEEVIEVVLTTGVTSAEGGSLATESRFSFTVEADPGGPGPGEVTVATIETTDPEPYAQGVDPGQGISIVISHPLDPTTVDADSVALSSDLSGRIGVGVALAEENRRIEVTPERAFRAGETVRVHLAASIDPSEDDVVFHGGTFTFRVRSEALDLEKTEVTVTSAAGSVAALRVGDFNLDGTPDVIYLVENSTSLHGFVGDSSGALTANAPIEHGQAILSMRAADIDRDGDLDVVVGTIDRTRLYLNEAVEENPGPETFRLIAGPEVVIDTTVHDVAIGDLDHAAGLDYVVDTDRGIEVYLGSLTAQPAQTIGEERQALSELVLADLDLDGHLDLVYGDMNSPAVVFHLGHGPGGGDDDAEGAVFGERREVPLTSEALQVAVDSIQPGGRPEIVVLTVEGASLQGESMRLLVSDDQGGYNVVGFTGGEPPPGGQEPPGNGVGLDTGRFEIADLEGDARPDVVLAAAALDKVLWFRNHDGEPLPMVGNELLSAPLPRTVRAADLTGDGIEEVIVSAMNEIHVIGPKEEEPPPPPPETFALAVVGSEARQGDTGASALVRLTNTAPLEGYEIYVTFDPAALTPTGKNTDGTVLEENAPELDVFEVREESSTIAISAVMDVVPPLDGHTLPAHNDDPLLRILFDVPEDAPLGETPLEFTDDTVLVVERVSKLPETTSGTMTILVKEEPPPPPTGNWKKIVDTSIDAGQQGRVEIRAGAEEKIDAFTTIVGFDPDIFEIMDIDLEGSATGQFDPELEVVDLKQDSGYFAYTVIFDFLAPFERQGIPPGQDFLLFNAEFRVRNGTADGSYPLTFRNEVGSPPLFNIFAFGGRSLFPQLFAGEVTVKASTETLFVRGDANSTRHLDISDAIFVMAHLFRGGEVPRCRDAADTDDDGAVRLTDPVFLLDYIFMAGDPPPPPFPEPGTDPTPDDIDCLEGI